MAGSIKLVVFEETNQIFTVYYSVYGKRYLLFVRTMRRLSMVMYARNNWFQDGQWRTIGWMAIRVRGRIERWMLLAMLSHYSPEYRWQEV